MTKGNESLPPIPPLNGWNEYKRLVLAELERLDDSVKDLVKSQENSHKEIVDHINKTKESLIEKLAIGIAAVDKKATDNETELKVIKAKSVMLAAFAGAVITIVGLIAQIVLGVMKP